MPADWTPLEIGMAALALLNGLISLRIAFAKGLTGTQKLLQTALVWLVPLLGMLLVYLFHKVDSEPRGPAEPPFGGGAGGLPGGAA